LGLLAVLMGAFAAHALRDQLPDDRRIVFEVGARYQMYHALAMVLVGLLERAPSAPRRLSLAGAFFFLGSSSSVEASTPWRFRASQRWARSHLSAARPSSRAGPCSPSFSYLSTPSEPTE
jgi:hypothetical protein